MRKIIYIEDDEGLCALVKRSLGRDGIVAIAAHDGETGLACLERERDVDVVAVDLHMPGLSGMETLERINSMPDHPPVVVVTGMQDSRMAVAALKAGAFDYVVKDVQGDFIFLLKAALQAAVDAMRLQRAKEVAEAEVRTARDRFEALAAERELLLREVNHRVGNSLQLIASMLTLQANAAEQPDVRHALTEATGRVLAVAQVHRRLYTSDDVQSVALDQYLAALVDDLSRTSTDASSPRISLSAEPILIDPDRAVALGVIVNELVMNALKYAYPDKSGEIRVELTRDMQGAGVLTVEDDGIGLASTPKSPHSTGLGSEIVRAMGDKLGARIHIDPAHSGTRVSVTFGFGERDVLPRPAA